MTITYIQSSALAFLENIYCSAAKCVHTTLSYLPFSHELSPLSHIPLVMHDISILYIQHINITHIL